MAPPALVSNTGISKLLAHVRGSGVPTGKVDGAYLKRIGLKSQNDVGLLNLFRQLGFLDPKNVPTATWRQYKATSDAEAKVLLGKAIKACYADLFTMYPDAYRRDDEALNNWMRGQTDKGDVTIARMLTTFKALRNLATFADGDDTEPDLISLPDSPATDTSEAEAQTAAGNGIPPGASQPGLGARPGITINVELHIAATSEPTVYENFFAAMRKYLYDDGS